MREGSEASRDRGIEAGNRARLVPAWLRAAEGEEVRSAIARVHEEIERAIAAETPRCEMSGRCCRFEEYGHRLYVTGLEAALTLIDAGAIGAGESTSSSRAVRDFTADAACPFQIGKSCGVHAHRPAGCRVYFCDPSWAPLMNDVAERAVERVRAIHDEHGVPYRYMEWRSLLTMFEEHAGPVAFRRCETPESGTTRITRDGEALP